MATSLAVAAPSAQADTSYLSGTPQLSTITGTASNPAPWNEWQGDSAGNLVTNPFTITGNNASVVDPAQVYPTYEPASGSTAFPNVAVDQGATATDQKSGSTSPNGDTSFPYQSGQVGTPGPLAGYCGSGDFNAETGLTGGATPAVSTEPSGETLPFGPAYFPHIVLNADGSLTGYFDYRPKDQNESVVAATSTDGGKSWTYDDQALQQDANYCASGDTNDDGQGHPNVLNLGGTTSAGDVTSGGSNELVTLQRSAGDNEGVGMLVHNLNSAGATPSTPLGNLPSSQPTGPDPDSFDTDTTSVSVSSSGTQTLNVSTTGTPGTLENLVAGGFVDLGSSGTPSSSNAAASDVIQCTGVTESQNPGDGSLGTVANPAAATGGQLTGCTTASGTVTVQPGDMLEQVIGYVSNQTPTSSNAISGDAQTAATAGSAATTFPFTLPNGPDSIAADGGYAQIDVSPSVADATDTSSQWASTTQDLGFTNELTGQQLNFNAPDRYYIDGVATYCTQSNNNPTSEIEDCTVPVGTASPHIAAGDPILADPVIPAGTDMTTGLVAPDGVVGELGNGFPTDGTFSIPANATYVMYTEKKANYWIAGELNKDLCGVAEMSTEKSSKQNSACPAESVSGGTARGVAIPTNAASISATSPVAIGNVTFNPWEYLGEDFGKQVTVTSDVVNGQDEGTFALAGSAVDFTMGDNATGYYDQVQCSGVETVSTPENLNSDDLAAHLSSISDVANPVAASVGSLQSGANDAFTGCEIIGVTQVSGAPGLSGGFANFGTNTMILPPGAALSQPDQLLQTGEGKAAKASNADKVYSNNEDLEITRVAWTTDGVNFYDAGLNGFSTSGAQASNGGNGEFGDSTAGQISGSDTSSSNVADATSSSTASIGGTSVALTNGEANTCASGSSPSVSNGTATYTDLSNPMTTCNPENPDGLVNLNYYAANDEADYTEMRWPGSGGSVIWNPSLNGGNGAYELFLSGAWAGDGDSDAFNQIFYATSTNGLDWSTPTPLVSTDYSFSASEAQDAALAGHTDTAVNISAYYSGRAYGPAVVPNPNGGGFWMVFAGYNVPKGAGTAGNVLNPAAVSGVTDQYTGDSLLPSQGQTSMDPSDAAWTIGSGGNGDDPAMYRNILADQLNDNGGAIITVNAPSGAVYGGTGTVSGSSNSTEPITYSADPSSSQVCSVSGTTVSYSGVGTCEIDASQPAGDGYTQSGSGTVSFTVAQAPLTITASSQQFQYGSGDMVAVTAEYSGWVNHDGPGSLSQVPTCGTSATNSSAAGNYQSTCSDAGDPNYSITYVPGTVTITQAPLTITASSATISYHSTVPAITASYQGFVNNDGVGSLHTKPTCSTTAAKTSAPGEYPSSCTGAVDSNYVISYVNGQVTVTKATSQTRLTLASRTLPDLLPLIFTVDVSGVTTPTGRVDIYDGSKLVEVLPLVHGEAVGFIWPLAAGTHSIEAVYEGDQDYETSSSTQTVTVIKTFPFGGRF